MTTGAPICRTCGAELKDNKGSRYCPNGCDICTARPVGSTYGTPRNVEREDSGRLVETGGCAGTCG